MRIAVLIAASVLVGGLFTGGRRGRRADASRPVAPASAAASRRPRPRRRRRLPAEPPARARPIADVDRVRSRPARPPMRRSSTRRPGTATSTQLGEDVAFTTPSGTSRCMTDPQSSTARWTAWWTSRSRRRPRPTSTASGTAAGSTSPARARRRFGARRSRPIRQRHGPAAALRPVAGLRRLPVPRRPGGPVLRQLRPPVGRPVQRRRRRAVRLPEEGEPACRHRRGSAAEPLPRCAGQATPFWRSSGSTPSANQYASSRCG